ncbi:response regulator transcription factor [Olivibacter sp. SDN3]|uniref:response regulator transcription factor n=1 Tax=Olivibacter sp. SDN3 TaxID=2764720 RepID=UPI001650FF11|nr:response regulator transcription factor [Olivibacter sp. SDN3]QNL48355.1 response regulator transcription factor [Olivibacter sp. SDN3]
MKIRLAIADNSLIRRDGIKAILQQHGFEVNYSFNCTETLNGHLTGVDILIWGADPEIPIDKRFVQTLKDSAPNLKIAILDEDNGIQPAIKAINSGVSAYITENVQKDELLFAIKYISQGKKYIDPSLTMKLFNKLSDFEDYISSLNTNLTLSQKEDDVLDLMLSGYANKEIAFRLFTTKKNIEDLRQNLIHKTGAKDNLSLILYKLHKKFIQS